jgi:hypothetical protein
MTQRERHAPFAGTGEFSAGMVWCTFKRQPASNIAAAITRTINIFRMALLYFLPAAYD